MPAKAAPRPQRKKKMSCRADQAPANPAGVFCPRIGLARTAGEHRSCPYCFGKEAEVRAGSRERFCDYVAGLDARAFGFPDDRGRFVHD